MSDDFDLDDDDDDFDDMDDLDFDDDGLDSPGKGRSPVEKLTTGFLQGAKDTALTASFQKKLIDEALPKGYSHTYDDVTKGIDVAKDLYDTAKESVRPAKNSLKKLTRLVANKAEGILPKKVKEKIDELTEPSSDGALGETDYNELEISETLKSIFGAQSEADETRDVETEKQRKIKDTRDDAKFKTTADMLTALRVGQDRLVSYQDNITNAFQRKTLELQLKQYFVAREQFTVLEGFVKDTKLQLDSIVHNSALPDMVKMRSSESLKQELRNRFYGGMAESIQDHTSGLRDKILQNAKAKVKGLGETFTSSITSAADMQEMLSEAEVDPTETAGSAAGGGVLNRGAGWVGSKIGKYLKEKPKVKKLGDDLEYLSGNKIEMAREWLRLKADYNEYDEDGEKKKGIMNKIESLLPGLAEMGLDLIPGFNAGFSRAENSLTMAEDASTWSVLNDRTLNEIIPGYLSSILQELEITRTGNSEIERTVFNFEKGQFTRESELKEDIMERILPKRETDSIRAELLEAVDELDLDKKLSPDAREALSRQMLLDTAENKGFNPVRYFTPSGLNHVSDPVVRDEIIKHITDTFLDSNGKFRKDDAKASEKRLAVSNKVKAAQGYLPNYKERTLGVSNTYGSDLITQMGLFTNNVKGAGKTLKELAAEEKEEKKLLSKMTPEERMAYKEAKKAENEIEYGSRIGNHKGILSNIANGEDILGTTGRTPTSGFRSNKTTDLATITDHAFAIRGHQEESVSWLSKIWSKIDACCNTKGDSGMAPSDAPNISPAPSSPSITPDRSAIKRKPKRSKRKVDMSRQKNADVKPMHPFGPPPVIRTPNKNEYKPKTYPKRQYTPPKKIQTSFIIDPAFYNTPTNPFDPPPIVGQSDPFTPPAHLNTSPPRFPYGPPPVVGPAGFKRTNISEAINGLKSQNNQHDPFSPPRKGPKISYYDPKEPTPTAFSRTDAPMRMEDIPSNKSKAKISYYDPKEPTPTAFSNDGSMPVDLGIGPSASQQPENDDNRYKHLLKETNDILKDIVLTLEERLPLLHNKRPPPIIPNPNGGPPIGVGGLTSASDMLSQKYSDLKLNQRARILGKKSKRKYNKSKKWATEQYGKKDEHISNLKNFKDNALDRTKEEYNKLYTSGKEKYDNREETYKKVSDWSNSKLEEGKEKYNQGLEWGDAKYKEAKEYGGKKLVEAKDLKDKKIKELTEWGEKKRIELVSKYEKLDKWAGKQLEDRTKDFNELVSWGDKKYKEAKEYGTKKYGEAKEYGTKKYGEAKEYGSKKLEELKEYKERKLEEAKVYKERKIEEAKEYKDRKLEEAKVYKERKLEEAKVYKDRKLEELKEYKERKLEEAKEYGSKKLEEAKEYKDRKLVELKELKQRKLAEVKEHIDELKLKAQPHADRAMGVYGDAKEAASVHLDSAKSNISSRYGKFKDWGDNSYMSSMAYLENLRNRKKSSKEEQDDKGETSDDWLPDIKSHLDSKFIDLTDALYDVMAPESEDGKVKKRLKGAREKARGALGKMSKGLSSRFNRTKSGIASILTLGAKKVTDIYVEGERRPALEARKLASGDYRDQDTGKIVKRLKDIKGVVVDREGNVVLTQEDVDKGLTGPNGKDAPKSLVRKLFNYMTLPTRVLAKGVSTVLTGALKGLSKLKAKFTISDIYVGGETTPRLRAKDLKAGNYLDKETGRTVRKIEDIKGTVLDSEGNVVLSKEDIDKGLYNTDGKPPKSLIKRLLMAPINIVTSPLKFISSLGSKLKDKFKSKFLTTDIYIKGSNRPALEAKKLKAGEYFDEETLNVIKKLKDIKGQVLDNEGNVVLTHEDIAKGLTTASGDDLKVGLVGKLVGYALAPTKLLIKGLGALGKFAGSKLGILKDPKNRVSDIYLKGIDDVPLLYAKDLRAGMYSDKATGAIVKTFNDIKGDVVDRHGNIVISAKDIEDDLLVTPDGISLKSIIKKIPMTAFGVAKSVFLFPYKVMGAILDNVKGPADVYVSGEAKPRLTAIKMKNGDYFTKSGKVIKRVVDIDGEVVDKEGEVLLSTADIEKGLVNAKGKKINIKKGLIGKAVGLAASGVSKAIGAVKGVVGGIGSFLKGGIVGMGKFFDSDWNLDLTSNSTKQVSILEEIKNFITSKWGGTKYDNSGDGLRDGSWAAQKANRKNKAGAGATKLVNGKRVAAGGAGAVAGGAAGGGLLSTLGDLANIKGAFGGGRPPVPGAPNGAPKGVLGKIGGLLGRGAMLIPGAGAVASAVGSVAASAGGMLAGAGAAIGGVLSAPVLIGATAIAAVGFVGWLAYKKLYKVPKGPIHKIRLAQYGVDPKNKKHLAMLTGFEKEIKDDVKWAGGVPTLNVDDAKVFKFFGVKTEDTAHVANFTRWFNERFKPVYLLHMAALKTHADGVKNLIDVDKELKDVSSKLDYLNAIDIPTTNTMPYDVRVSPFSAKDDPLSMGRNEIRPLIAEQRKKLIDEGAVAKEKTPTVAEDTDKEASDVESADQKTKEDEASSPVGEAAVAAAAGKGVSGKLKDTSMLDKLKGLGKTAFDITPIGMAAKLFNRKKKDGEDSENPEDQQPSNLKTLGSMAFGSTLPGMLWNKFKPNKDKTEEEAPKTPLAELMEDASKDKQKEAEKVAIVRELPVSVDNYSGAYYPLLNIRMKTHGLTTMNRTKVNLLLSLEEDVLKDINVGSKDIAFSGKPEEYLFRYGHMFSFVTTDLTHRNEWLAWFTKRFIPTYLSFVSSIKSFKKNPKDASRVTADEALVIADTIATTKVPGSEGSVWGVRESPWKRYKINTNKTSILEDRQAIVDSLDKELKDGLTPTQEKEIKEEVKDTPKGIPKVAPSAPAANKYEEELDSNLTELKQNQVKSASATQAQKKSTSKATEDAMFNISTTLTDSLAVQRQMLKALMEIGLLTAGSGKLSEDELEEIKKNSDIANEKISKLKGNKRKPSVETPINMIKN